QPRLSGRQSAPRSVDSKKPPVESPRYRWFLSRGSTDTEWVTAPPGGANFGSSLFDHCLRIGWLLNPTTSSQVLPPSSVRPRPWGDVPAYHTPGSLACPGVSQNTAETDRPGATASTWSGRSSSVHFSVPSTFGKRGGRSAS